MNGAPARELDRQRPVRVERIRERATIISSPARAGRGAFARRTSRAMHTRPFDLGDGQVIVVERARELEQLSAGRAALVSERLARLFAGPERELEKIARGAKSKPFARWLGMAARSSITIEIYETRDFGSSAWLALDFGTRPTAGGELPFHVYATGGGGRMPRDCPPRLAEVLRGIGGLANQIGASGTLISAAELEPAWSSPYCSHLVDEIPKSEAKRLVPFYECDGDVVCYSRGTDRAVWLGNEWGHHGAKTSVGKVIDDLFTAFCRLDYYRPSS